MRRTSPLAALAALAALTLFSLAGGEALAASGTATSSVRIRKPVTLTKQADMNFGEILPPTAGSQTFVLAPDTGILTPGVGDGVRYGTPVAASFDLAGQANKAITVVAAVMSDFDGGVSLTALTTSGDTSAIPGGGSGNIKVGGTLTVQSGAADGDRTAAVELTVNYQ